MATISGFKARRTVDKTLDGKANETRPIYATVGNGDGSTVATGRNNFYWIRLYNDDNRLAQVFCDIVNLAYDDEIYVARARDRKTSYYEFVAFIQDSGGGTLPLICPRFAQVVYVSENSCQYDTLGAAITYINGLAAGPAATRLFLVKMQAGNFAEAGDVTIPSYVTVEGCGEATELEMGANSLILSNYTNLADLVIESSDPVDAVRLNGVQHITLKGVRVIQGAAADCFHIYGDRSDVQLRDCIAEATVNNAVGFHVGDTMIITMERCIADDTTNFADALLLDTWACDVTTRYCTFRAAGDDVDTAGTSTWRHLACHFDPNNVSIAGTHIALPTKRFNQTVIVAEEGGDFQAVSEAITWINAQGDAAAGKRYTILVVGGNFAEAGNITIPSYVDVVGMGESSRIEMGANTLLMSDNAALLNLAVTSSSGTAIEIENADCILRNVHITAAGTYGVRIHGDSDCKLYDVVVDGSAGCSYGIHVDDTATPLLEQCTVDDTTNFSVAALWIAIASVTVTSRLCKFHGASGGDDVWSGNGSTWNSYKDQFSLTNTTLAGTADMQDANVGDSFAFTVENTSGGAISPGAIGYIDNAGEFKTTATAYSDVAWAVAVIGGANNADIWVVRRGKATVTLNGNCNAGDYLYTSTTAAQAQPQSYVRSEVFAVALTANAAGAGGTCDALLLCHTQFIALTSTNNIWVVNTASDSDFVAKIDDNAGAHGGQGLDATHVPYDNVTAGNENVVDPVAATELAKMVLWNTTRGTERLVTSLDAANDWIGTVNTADAWADNDDIEIRSQTCTIGAAVEFFDLDFSETTEVPELTRAVQFLAGKTDSIGFAYVVIHPYTAYASTRQMLQYNQASGTYNYATIAVSLNQRRFCCRFSASGAGTANQFLRLMGVWVAAP